MSCSSPFTTSKSADVEKAWKHFELCEAECRALLEAHNAALTGDKANKDGTLLARKPRFPLLAAYDLCLKCSHLFNILDARGAISVTERVGVIARVRALAVGIAKAWVDQQRTHPDERSDRRLNPLQKRRRLRKKRCRRWVPEDCAKRQNGNCVRTCDLHHILWDQAFERLDGIKHARFSPGDWVRRDSGAHDRRRVAGTARTRGALLIRERLGWRLRLVPSKLRAGSLSSRPA